MSRTILPITKTLPQIIPTNIGIITCRRQKTEYLYHKNYDYVSINIERQATARKNVRPLTDKEKYNIARLGTMRIWKLKDKLNKIKSTDPNSTKE